MENDPPTHSRAAGILTALAAAAMLAVFAARELAWISYASPTFDEAYYTAYGYSLVKTGDRRLANDKPNLVPLLAAAPLAAAGVPFDTSNPHWLAAGKNYGEVWLCALDFLHNNKVPADRIIFLARLPIAALGLLLGAAVFIWSSRLWGAAGGLLSLFLYTTCPNILANSGLVTEDVSVSLFSFFAVYFYRRFSSGRERRFQVFTAVSLALAVNSKHTALLLPPLLAAHCLLENWKLRAEGGLKRAAIDLGFIFGGALAALLPFYGVSLFGGFFSAVAKTFRHVGGGQMSFMNGRYSVTGFRDYFLFAIGVKTTLAALALALLSLAARLRARDFLAKDGLWLALFPAALLAAASFSHFHIGLRHVLPVYPFLYVFAGGAAGLFSARLYVLPLAALVAWQGWASWSVHPYYLTYFNEAAGGPAQGDRRLLDSNLDWGQDLKALRLYLGAEKVSDLVLSYYGSMMPSYLGRSYQDLFSTAAEKSWHLNSPEPEKEFLAVSATSLRGPYYREFGPAIHYWLAGRTPKTVIGNNIRIYDITTDAAAHLHLANVYFMTGNPPPAEREAQRALKIDSKDRTAAFLLALIYLKEPQTERLGARKLAEWLQRNRFVPPDLEPLMPAELFRYRYFVISDHAAQKLKAAGRRKEAEAMAALAGRLKTGR